MRQPGLAVLLVLGLTTPLIAQSESDGTVLGVPVNVYSPPLSTQSDELRVRSIGVLWLMGIDGDIGAKGRTASVDESFADLLDDTDTLFGIAGRVEIGKGRWGGFVDGLYNRIAVDNASGPAGLASIDVTINQVLVDFGVMYRVAEWERESLIGEVSGMVSLDAYGGGRYSMLEMDLDPAMAPSRDDTEEWIDPIVGIRVAVPIARHMHLETWGDVGGFGVASEFTWSASAVLAYRFELFDLPFAVFGGYRAVGQDYEDGAFEWDVVLHGPMLGFAFAF